MVMLLTAMVPVLFSSCGGNEPTPDSYEELIVGEWDCTRYDFDAEIDGEKEVGSAYPEPLEWVWKFSKTGVLSFPWYDKPDNVTIRKFLETTNKVSNELNYGEMWEILEIYIKVLNRVIKDEHL